MPVHTVFWSFGHQSAAQHAVSNSIHSEVRIKAHTVGLEGAGNESMQQYAVVMREWMGRIHTVYRPYWPYLGYSIVNQPAVRVSYMSGYDGKK
jgi:hypothetical protein